MVVRACEYSLRCLERGPRVNSPSATDCAQAAEPTRGAKSTRGVVLIAAGLEGWRLIAIYRLARWAVVITQK